MSEVQDLIMFVMAMVTRDATAIVEWEWVELIGVAVRRWYFSFLSACWSISSFMNINHTRWLLIISVLSLLSLSLVLLVLFSAKGIYNRYFHPLSRFPGPFWGSVTDLYLVGIINSIPTCGLELHRRYGRIVRIAPNLLSFSDPKLLPVVYHRRADKTPFYSNWLFQNASAMFTTMSHKEHAARSKLIAPCGSMKSLREFEGRIDTRILEVCEMIKRKASCSKLELDFAELIRWFLSDVFSDVVYGQSLGCVAQASDVNGLVKTLQGLYTMSGMVAVLPWLMVPLVNNPVIRKFIFARTKAFQNLKKLVSHYREMLAKRSQSPSLSNKKCFFDRLSFPEHQKGLQISPENIEAEVLVFTAAALEAVSAFFSPFIENVIQNRAVYAKVKAEIDAADARGDLSSPVPKYDETCQLPYFMACIQETFRFDAPAQTLLPRYISKEGIHAYGMFIPGGTEIATTGYIIHRDTATFGPDADIFRPERWLEDTARNEHMKEFGMWFGYGSRECPGKNFAVLQIHKLCVQLFRQFEISPPTSGKSIVMERWAVAMFWNHWLCFQERAIAPISE